MYIKCIEGESVYIIDTDRKEVFEIVYGVACLMRPNSDNFMRFHPYLESIEETTTMPKEIVEYMKDKNNNPLKKPYSDTSVI